MQSKWLLTYVYITIYNTTWVWRIIWLSSYIHEKFLTSSFKFPILIVVMCPCCLPPGSLLSQAIAAVVSAYYGQSNMCDNLAFWRNFPSPLSPEWMPIVAFGSVSWSPFQAFQLTSKKTNTKRYILTNIFTMKVFRQKGIRRTFGAK